MLTSRPQAFRTLTFLGTASAVALTAVLAVASTGREPARTSRQARIDPGELGASTICRSSTAMQSRVRLASARTGISPMGQNQPLAAVEFVESQPPLWEGLGELSYKVTTANAQSQQFFDQGLRLAYAFNHAEAQRAFRHAQRLDPGCAMCFWGEALVLGPNINMPMEGTAEAVAFTAITKARDLSAGATARERDLIAALARRYSAEAKSDRKSLDADYAAAMRDLAAKYPNDDEIATLYAEALMNLSPWDYWLPGGRLPQPQSTEIIPTLERVLARNPDHPGAIHYYIHAVEASDRPERAEPFADRLRGAMPAAGHMVHMPSHIYYRVGRYRDALDVNKDAVAADERYLAETNAPIGVYRLGYYPHNVHFVLASAQMFGDGKTVLAAAERLGSIVPDEAAKAVALVQPVKAAAYFAHALFSTPDKVLALAAPTDDLPYVKAMWHYARGIALVARGDLVAARREADAIATLERLADFSSLTAAGIPSNEVLRIALHVVHGRIFQAEQNYSAAIEQFAQAEAKQAKLPYMEPPYWYYPVSQSLGAVLLQAGRLDEAEGAFQRALQHAPNSAWIQYGLLELAKLRGDAASTAKAQAALERRWIGERRLLSLHVL